MTHFNTGHFSTWGATNIFYFLEGESRERYHKYRQKLVFWYWPLTFKVPRAAAAAP